MRHVVGIAEMKISNKADDSIITYALGSCIGITVYDPVTRVGGLLHCMLPLSRINIKKAQRNPFMFVDTGVPAFLNLCISQGANKDRMIIKAAGASSLYNHTQTPAFNIGKRNITMLRKILWKNNLLMKSHDFGGNYSRTLHLSNRTGQVTVKINGISRLL